MITERKISPRNIWDQAMKSLRVFILGILLVSFGLPLQASAESFERDGGLYWSVRGGLSQVRNLAIWSWAGYEPTYDNAQPPNLLIPGLNDHIEYRSLEMDYGFVAGASIGYTVLYPESAADLRFELEGIYRRNDEGQINSQWWPTSDNADSVSLFYEVVPVSGSLEVRSAMFNFLVDFHTQTRITPYLGLGAGISQLVADGYTLDLNRLAVGEGYPQYFDETLYALSWQGIAGIGYHLSPGTMLTAEFRYFRLAADRWSELFQTDELRAIKFDDWSIGARFTF